MVGAERELEVRISLRRAGGKACLCFAEGDEVMILGWR